MRKLIRVLPVAELLPRLGNFEIHGYCFERRKRCGIGLSIEEFSLLSKLVQIDPETLLVCPPYQRWKVVFKGEEWELSKMLDTMQV